MKTKLISLALAALMVVTLIPFGIFSASAAVTTTLPADMPTTIPTGKNMSVDLAKSELFVDVSTVGKVSHTDRGTYEILENGMMKYTSGTSNIMLIRNRFQTESGGSDVIEASTPVGASGIMFYLDNSNQPTENSDFVVSFQVNASRGKAMYFDSTVKVNYNGGTAIPDATCTYYINSGSGWSDYSTTAWVIGQKTSGWYYIPFESFFYHGSWNQNSDHASIYDADGYGMSYAYFMEHYNNASGISITSLQFRARENRVLTLGDFYFVYPDLGVASENAATKELLPDLKITDKEPKTNGSFSGEYDAVLDGNKVTISGNTANDGANAAGGKVWLGSSVATRDLSTANGIRFYVDSSNLGATQLLLRLRLKDAYSPYDANNETYPYENIKNYVLLTNAANGTASIGEIDKNIQYVMRSAGSTAYVYDANGNVVSCYGSDVNLTSANTDNSDVIALPAGYKGYVYIPMDSFYACIAGSNTGEPLIGFDKAVDLGLFKNIDKIALIQAYSDSTNAANYSVSYSDFQIVYEDIEVTQTSVSLGNDLSLNVKAVANNGATVESATYTMDGKSYTAKVNTIDGGYAIVCDGILPQDAGKTVSVTVNGKVGDIAVTNTISTSVKDYCLALLASDESNAAKNAAADLLRYAAAADTFANETSTILDGATLDGLGAATDFENLSLTNGATTTDTTLAGYNMTGAALRLENALAIKLFVTVPADSTAAVTASFTLGEGEAVVVDVVDGVAVFGGIGACDFDKTITVALTVDEAEVQTLTYKVTDYFAAAFADEEMAENELALVKALYDYGVSASAYADSLQ